MKTKTRLFFIYTRNTANNSVMTTDVPPPLMENIPVWEKLEMKYTLVLPKQLPPSLVKVSQDRDCFPKRKKVMV